MDIQFSKEQAQGPWAAFAPLPPRRVRLVGFHPHQQALMGPLPSPLCHHHLLPLQAVGGSAALWMKATCRMDRNTKKRRWSSPSLHLPLTSEYTTTKLTACSFTPRNQHYQASCAFSWVDFLPVNTFDSINSCTFSSDLCCSQVSSVRLYIYNPQSLLHVQWVFKNSKLILVAMQ